MDQPPYTLDRLRGNAVIEAIREVCSHRGWKLWAAHARTNHVHAVVEAEDEPERIMNDFKIYASRRLNQMGIDALRRKRWARHGSTRWLWSARHLSAAIEYVVREQGAAMAAWEDDE